MSSQILYLFHSSEKRQKIHLALREKLEQANISDFVTIDLDAQAQKKIVYPYAVNVAFQKYSKQELLHSIELLGGQSHLDMEEDEFDIEEEYLVYLEQVFIVSLEMSGKVDSLEASFAEKFESIIGVQNWKITSIKKNGTFDSDPRYSEDLLIKELKGHDGNSQNKFVGFSESSQKERINEIYEASQKCLGTTPHWAEFIAFVLSNLEKSKEKFKVIVDIYNPDSIVTALYFTLVKQNFDYLPLFLIIIDYPERNKMEFYKGEIKSIGVKPTLELFTTEKHDEVNSEFLRIMLGPENEIDAFRMGLWYSIKRTDFVDDHEVSNQFVVLDDSMIVPDSQLYDSIEEYIISNKDSIALMLKNYSRFSMHT
ncbi:MAG: hypothetical protein DI535_05960 [Citrobacter freundii]|nr:MAG: hypothetical protein DI535_05960 [Citrobacter freundii]